MESRQYTRHLSLSELKWFAIGIGFFILSIATATVNYRLSGISLLVGLLFIIWKFSVTVLFLFTPRRMTLTETALQAGHRVIHYDALESMRLLHQSDKLILRHSGGKKYVIYLDFWNDGNGIYDRLAAELVRRHGSALGARLAADGRLKFGKVTALADRLEHKNRAVPYAQIASIRTQREEGAGSSMSYLMISTATGRICKIDRSTIVNEAAAAQLSFPAFTRLTTFLYKDESMELYVSKTSQQNMPVEFNIYYSRSKTLVGIVFWICMMGVFIALAVNMATDPEEPKTGGAVFMGLICCGSLLFIVRLARSFLSAAKPAVTISREGIRFCNGKFAAWTNIAENTLHSQSINFIPAAAGIKIVLHEGKPIHFATTVIALSSDRYLEMCDLYSSQALE